MNREQHALAFQVVIDQVEDEGDPYRARLGFVGNQKVGADVQLAVVFFVKACGLFNVHIHRVFGNGQAVILLDPAFFFEGRGLQVHPDGLEFGEFLEGFDLFLEKPAVGKRENIEHD